MVDSGVSDFVALAFAVTVEATDSAATAIMTAATRLIRLPGTLNLLSLISG
jgi:hypothetical protein